MFHIIVLILWLLATTVFCDDLNTTTSTVVPDDNNSTKEPSQCHGDEDCEYGVCVRSICVCCKDLCSSRNDSSLRRRCRCSWWLTDEELKVVAQAVLGIAVFVTCVALGSMLWKVCARRIRRRHVASAADFLDDATSLSSEQVFVVERLRDRPPCYEDAAMDFAVEKPPAYSEVVVGPEEELEQRHQTVSVGGIPVTLVGANLIARDFVAPPPYSERHQVMLLTPPPLPPTPPVQRLRRCVRKVVVIRRIGRSIPSLEVCSSSNNNCNNLTSNSSSPKQKACQQNDSSDHGSFSRKADTSVSNAIIPESRELQTEIDTVQPYTNATQVAGRATEAKSEEKEHSNSTFNTNE